MGDGVLEFVDRRSLIEEHTENILLVHRNGHGFKHTAYLHRGLGVRVDTDALKDSSHSSLHTLTESHGEFVDWQSDHKFI